MAEMSRSDTCPVTITGSASTMVAHTPPTESMAPTSPSGSCTTPAMGARMTARESSSSASATAALAASSAALVAATRVSDSNPRPWSLDAAS